MTGEPVIVPCGKCEPCRYKLTRTRTGKSILESKYPPGGIIQDPSRIHKFDLTYKETPMTQPRPHVLGITENKGKFEPYSGPFDDNYRNHRINVIDGALCYTKRKRPLTKYDLATEHRRYLIARLGWTPQEVKQWETGNYKSVQTTRIQDAIRFMDRLRKAVQKKNPQDPLLRYLFSSEYGGVNQRPHYHCILWGLHPRDATMVHDYWEDYSYNESHNGHVNPSRYETQMDNKSIIKGGAEAYAVKDVSKGVLMNSATPSLLEQETPRIWGSTRPPIGDGFYDLWFETHIMRNLAQYELDKLQHIKPKYRDLHLILKLRELYTHYHIVLPPDKHGRPRSQSYPTTARWRLRVREDLNITESQWDEATETLEIENARLTEQIDTEPELRAGYQLNLEERRRKHKAASEKREQRLNEKRALFKATGNIRPAGRM